MKRSIVALLVFLLSVISATAQQINTATLDSLFDKLDSHHLAMGSIAISTHGKLVYRRSTGFARIDAHDPVRASASTQYAIGSITKMFTSTMIFQLIEEKRISLHDTLAKYFDFLPNASKITIRNLLNHRSGLPDFTRNTDFDAWKENRKTHEELLAMIAAHPPDFEPGAKADYCNSNYLVLGYIIEKITGKPYQEVLKERIISRVGLTKTHFDHVTVKNPDESFSYKYENGGWTTDKVVDLENFGGAGGIMSTPTDLLRFIQALFGGRLISAASLDTMKTMVDDFGMGMFTYGFEQHNGFGHNGKTEGFASSLSLYPGDDFAIAYCTNGEVYPKDDILNKVLGAGFNHASVSLNVDPVLLPDDSLKTFTGTYTSGPNGFEVVSTLEGHSLRFNSRGHAMILRTIGPRNFMSPEFGFFFEFKNDGHQLVIQDVDAVYRLEKK